MLCCIDIGNTHTHFGWISVPGGPVRHAGVVHTRAIDHPLSGIMPPILAQANETKAVAFCSVVPAAARLLQRVLNERTPQWPVFELTPATAGVPITYPTPAEIGQDRLANVAGALALVGAPVVIIDLGTAVTFDIVTTRGGYEGGIIAPGVDVMRSYLHERTAQLPLLDDSLDLKGVVGRSTLEAMRIGTVLGFAGMIQALLEAVCADLAARETSAPTILSTGGTAKLITGRTNPLAREVPDLTLQGLATAWTRSQT